MPHISQKPLKKRISRKMTQDFLRILGSLRPRSKLQKFLEEFLTQTERTMLAKRLALIFMVKRGYPFTAITKTLKMSPSTVLKTWKRSRNGEYTIIQRMIEKEKRNKEFWDSLEQLLLMGMPPIGRRRWQYLNTLYPKKKNNK